MNQSQTIPRSFGQFSLQWLLAAMAFVGLGLAAWNSFGLVGVAGLIALVSVLVANLIIALFGAKLGCPILAGVLGGAVLWPMFAVGVSMLEESSLLREFGLYAEDTNVPDSRFLWVTDLLSVVFASVLVGLVCGSYARFKYKSAVRANLRRPFAYSLAFVVPFCIWCGWKAEQARNQRELVAWVVQLGGQVKYDYEMTRNEGTLAAPGPDWLRKYLGVDFLADVVSLELVNSQVNDVSRIARLGKLTSLKIEGAQASNVASLAELKNLKTLSLLGTQVSDVSPLAGLQSLESLNLDYTPVSNVASLAALESLTTLSLVGAEVSDVSPLAQTRRLKSLNLKYTPVNDVSPLARMRSLEDLDLSETVWGLKKLKYVERLNLSGTKLTAVTPLAGLQLYRLDLSGTHVSDLTPLVGLSVSSLDLSGTPVRNVSPLAEVSGLTSLNLRDTQVTDITPLASMKRLLTLNLSGTQVSDVSPLAELAVCHRYSLAERQ